MVRPEVMQRWLAARERGDEADDMKSYGPNN